MTLVTPKAREELADMEPIFQAVEASMGFVPTSMLTMAHWPELVQSFGGFAGGIVDGGDGGGERAGACPSAGGSSNRGQGNPGPRNDGSAGFPGSFRTLTQSHAAPHVRWRGLWGQVKESFHDSRRRHVSRPPDPTTTGRGGSEDSSQRSPGSAEHS